MKRRLLAIQGYFGFSNTGDEAILHCALAQLRELQRDRPYLDLVVFSENPDLTSRIHNVQAVSAVVPATLTDFCYRFLPPNRMDYIRALQAFLTMDTLMVGGGGLLFDNPNVNIWLRRQLTKIEWAKRLGKQVVILGVGVGPVHMEDSREHMRRALSRVDLITVRTNDGRHTLEEIGVTGPPIHTTCDFAYLLRSAPEDRIAEIMQAERLLLGNRPRICLCLHGTESVKLAQQESLIQFCNYATSTLGADLWFIPMQVGGPFDDRVAAREIVEQIDQSERAYIIEGQYWPWETQGLMARCEAVLAVRLHGVVLAINNQTPVFGISYMPKVRRVFRELGRPDWQTAADGVTGERLISGFSQLWNQREQAQTVLRTAHADFHRRALSNFTILAEKLDERYGR